MILDEENMFRCEETKREITQNNISLTKFVNRIQ
jgi:hypothetical protein